MDLCTMQTNECRVIPFTCSVVSESERLYRCIKHNTFHCCNDGTSCVPVEDVDNGVVFCNKTNRVLSTQTLETPEEQLKSIYIESSNMSKTSGKISTGITQTTASAFSSEDEHHAMTFLARTLSENILREFDECELISSNKVIKRMKQLLKRNDFSLEDMTLVKAFCHGLLLKGDIQLDEIRNSGSVRKNRLQQTLARYFTNHDLFKETSPPSANT